MNDSVDNKVVAHKIHRRFMDVKYRDTSTLRSAQICSILGDGGLLEGMYEETWGFQSTLQIPSGLD